MKVTQKEETAQAVLASYCYTFIIAGFCVFFSYESLKEPAFKLTKPSTGKE
jgi:hypothetical protein